ncbi:choloylglycine hydrolase [Candidatus Dependentiae bacterium Noda2021]|nr:choloylglycine hydrolase [Candidatus Dependentiae bacterium Noda2021]
MCTGIRLASQEQSVVYARTLEFGNDLESQILMIPRNYSFSGTALDNKPGLVWKSKYAVLGANACNLLHFVDGVNEVGLAGGLFYFPGYARYQEVQQNEGSISLAPWQLLTWILTTCATVKEVTQKIPTIRVVKAIFGPWNMSMPVHCIVHDATSSLVIEYLNGQLTMYDNPLGVLTNAPHFEWHMTNLNNYIGLSSVNHQPLTLDGIQLQSFGQGSGLCGLPGDFTPPSRFVRAVIFSQSIKNSISVDEAIDNAFHILNLFDIPQGIIRDASGKDTTYDYTQWTSLCDLQRKQYYFTTYDNKQVHKVELLSMNLESAKEVVIAMKRDNKPLDITPKNT